MRACPLNRETGSGSAHCAASIQNHARSRRKKQHFYDRWRNRFRNGYGKLVPLFQHEISPSPVLQGRRSST